MANRDQALQIRRYHKEGSPGGGGTPDTIAPDLKLMVALQGDPNVDVVASGYLYGTDSVPGMYFAKGTFDLPWSFSQIQFVLDSLFKAVTATGANLTKTRVWTPSVNALDTIATYAAEAGQTGAVDKFKYLVCNSLKAKIEKQGAQAPITGDVLAQWNGAATSLSGSPTNLVASIVPKLAWNIYTADTFPHLASAPSQVSVVHSVEIDYGPVRTEAAYINSNNVGWDALGIAVAPKNAIKIAVPKDVSGTDYLGAGLFSIAKWQQRTPIFLRAAAQGNFIETVSAIDYYEMMIIDMCLRIVGPPTEAPVGPFVGQVWPCQLMVDLAGSGKAWEWTTQSTQG